MIVFHRGNLEEVWKEISKFSKKSFGGILVKRIDHALNRLKECMENIFIF
jgi:hypothetical protein